MLHVSNNKNNTMVKNTTNVWLLHCFEMNINIDLALVSYHKEAFIGN